MMDTCKRPGRRPRDGGFKLVALCLLLPSAGGLYAQTVPDSRPELRPGWTFTPSFTFGGAWDDNVLLVGDDSAALLPREYVTAIAPGGALDYRGSRLQLASGYRGSFVLYRELSELNSLDQNARGHLTYRATPRATLNLGQTFTSARTTDVVEFIGAPFSRIGSRSSITSAGLGVRLSQRTSLDTGYSLRMIEFDDEVDNQIFFPGGHEHQFSTAASHQITARTRVGATYGLRRVLANREPAPVMIHHAAGTVAYRLADNLDADGSFGISRLGAVTETPAQTGLAWRAGISGRFEHFTATAHYVRSVVPSFGFGGTFQNEELVGNLHGAFARNRASWQAGAAWRDNDPLVRDQPSRRTLWLTSRLGYALTPWLRVEGYHAYGRQNSQRDAGLVHRNRLGFEIVLARPIRVAPH